MITYWPSPAKLNLFLYIVGQRSDGYHMLQTAFQFLNYGDVISIERRWDGQVNLLTPIAGIANKDNLIIQAASLLMEEAKRKNRLPTGSGANIRIKKKLPIGGGLGGGSSNAATILVALNQLWNCKFTEDSLEKIGLRLGADVPVFIRGRAAFAENIGEILHPIQLKESWYLVVYPNISIPTSIIFKDPELPRSAPKRSMEMLLKCEFSNVFEIIVRKHFLEVNEAISWLTKYAPSRMTGTGACIFAKFDTKFAAYKVLKQTPKWLYSFVAKGVNISPLKKVKSR